MKNGFVLVLALLGLPLLAAEPYTFDTRAYASASYDTRTYDAGAVVSYDTRAYDTRGVAVRGDVTVTNEYGHDNMAVGFFGAVKHRIHIGLHGSPYDPNPRVVKALVPVLVKNPPAPRTYSTVTREIQVQVPETTMTTETREIQTAVRDLPPPPRVETRQIQVQTPVTAYETREVPVMTRDVCGNPVAGSRTIQVPTRSFVNETREIHITVQDPPPPPRLETRQIQVQVPVTTMRTETRTVQTRVLNPPEPDTFRTEHRTMVVRAAPVCEPVQQATRVITQPRCVE